MSKRAVAIIIAGFLTVFVAFAVRYSYGLLLPHMLPSLAITKTEAGIIYSSYFIAYTIFSPILGLLVDRSDARLLLTFFVVLLGIGACLMAVASTITHASIFFFLAGVGHSACWVPVVTVVMRWVSEKRRATALAVVDLGSAMGIAVWSMVIPLITVSGGWRSAWVALGLSAVVVAVINFLSIRSHPPETRESRDSEAEVKDKIPIKTAYRTILRDSKFYLIGFSYMLISFSIIVPFTFLATYANKELMISYKSATGLIAVIAIAGVFGKLALSRLSDGKGRIRVMMLCGIITAAGHLGMAHSQSFLWLILFSILFGIGYGAIWPVYAAAARDFFSMDCAGSVVGLWTLFLGVGSTISPAIAGWTIDTTGSYVWAFVIAMAGSIISVLLLIPVGKAGHA